LITEVTLEICKRCWRAQKQMKAIADIVIDTDDKGLNEFLAKQIVEAIPSLVHAYYGLKSVEQSHEYIK